MVAITVIIFQKIKRLRFLKFAAIDTDKWCARVALSETDF